MRHIYMHVAGSESEAYRVFFSLVPLASGEAKLIDRGPAFSIKDSPVPLLSLKLQQELDH